MESFKNLLAVEWIITKRAGRGFSFNIHLLVSIYFGLFHAHVSWTSYISLKITFIQGKTGKQLKRVPLCKNPPMETYIVQPLSHQSSGNPRTDPVRVARVFCLIGVTLLASTECTNVFSTLLKHCMCSGHTMKKKQRGERKTRRDHPVPRELILSVGTKYEKKNEQIWKAKKQRKGKGTNEKTGLFWSKIV